MPKDSLGIYEFGKDTVIRIARVKTFKLPTKGDGRWLAYHLEKSLPAAGGPRRQPDSLARISRMERMADSLMRVADSIRNKANEAKQKAWRCCNRHGAIQFPPQTPRSRRGRHRAGVARFAYRPGIQVPAYQKLCVQRAG